MPAGRNGALVDTPILAFGAAVGLGRTAEGLVAALQCRFVFTKCDATA